MTEKLQNLRTLGIFITVSDHAKDDEYNAQTFYHLLGGARAPEAVTVTVDLRNCIKGPSIESPIPIVKYDASAAFVNRNVSQPPAG